MTFLLFTTRKCYNLVTLISKFTQMQPKLSQKVFNKTEHIVQTWQKIFVTNMNRQNLTDLIILHNHNFPCSCETQDNLLEWNPFLCIWCCCRFLDPQAQMSDEPRNRSLWSNSIQYSNLLFHSPIINTNFGEHNNSSKGDYYDKWNINLAMVNKVK